MMTMYAFEWVAVMIEAFGYVLAAILLGTGTVQWHAALGMYVLSQVVGIVIALCAVHTANRWLDVYRGPRNVLLLMLWAVVGQFGYRQLTVVWRIRSLLGGANVWGAMPRVGFGNTPTAGGGASAPAPAAPAPAVTTAAAPQPGLP